MSAEPDRFANGLSPTPIHDAGVSPARRDPEPAPFLEPRKREFEGHVPRWGAGLAPLAKRLRYLLRRFLRRRR